MKKWVIANFKMYKTVQEATIYAKKFKKLVKNSKNYIVICPSFVCVESMAKAFKETNILVGGQNCFQESEGAFTGETSAKMLKSAGANLVILGHSERRRYFGETDEIVNKKILQAQNEGLTAVVCLADDGTSGYESRIKEQLKTLLNGIDETKIIFAFEPAFAIGTGKAMAVCDIEPVIKTIKNEAKKILKINVQVLYGGSVNKDNAKDFLSSKVIDGLLIGGASLNEVGFAEICNI